MLSGTRNWFGRAAAPPAQAPAPATPVVAGAAIDAPVPAVAHTWPAERLGVTDALWGEGFQFPGGEIETLHLAKPLGLSAASSLLLLGAGGGGPPCSVASKLGVWVSGYEADPDLASAAGTLIQRAKLGRRVQMDRWDPASPAFPPHYYHHGLALEPLHGNQPEPVLAALSLALKPGGHLMLVELVADSPLNPADPVVAQWAALEHRDPETLPTELTITRVLGRLGFDVRIVEDVSQRHTRQALIGWRAVVRGMELDRPSRRRAALMVKEAELWLLRLRLIRAGRLRLVRWHAIGRGAG